MPKYQIELPHETNTLACAHAVEAILKTGSHFFTHADWGCRDGDHRAWIVVEVDSKDEARRILPPAVRPQAKIVALNQFSLEEIREIIRQHEG